jgi:uncharacterized protein
MNPRRVSGALLDACHTGTFQAVTCDALLQELSGVLVRPKLLRKHGRSRAAIRAYVELLRAAAEVFEVTGAVRVCRDPKDDVVIETAVRGSAAYVVSEDQDLHAREVIEALRAWNCRVLTVTEFLAELLANEPGCDP